MATNERTRQHYASVLGPIYAWSKGDDPIARGRSWLHARSLLSPETRVLDLGAGFGAHALPLARAGANVTAVDFDPGLLEALQQSPGAQDIKVVCEDISTFVRTHSGPWEVVLCLGDTWTHLENVEAAQDTLSRLSRQLTDDGVVVLEWRDTSGPSPQDLDRFIQVARDDSRIMHCFLEALDEQTLRVTDIVTEFGGEGPVTSLGSYKKLRLSAQHVTRMAERAGLVVRHLEVKAGMTELHAALAP